MSFLRTGALILVVALAVPAAAGARTPIRVGIGDQHRAMFDQPAFTALKLRRASGTRPAGYFVFKRRLAGFLR